MKTYLIYVTRYAFVVRVTTVSKAIAYSYIRQALALQSTDKLTIIGACHD